MKGGLTYNELRKRPMLVLAFVVTAALAALLTMATALSITDFLQLIFPQAGSTEVLNMSNGTPVEKLLAKVYVFLANQGASGALLLYAVLLLVVYGLKNVCSYLAAVSYAGIKTGVLRELRNKLNRAALNQPFSEWSSQAQGQWLSRMSNDMAEYEANVLDSLQSLVSAVITMLIYIIMLLYLDWRLTLLVIVVIGIGTLLLSASRKLKRQSSLLQSLNGELMSTTQETIDSLKEIKAATAIDYVNERQREQNCRFTQRRISIYRRIYAASPLSDFVGNTIVVAILIIGAHRVLGPAASLSPALFVPYIMIYVLLLTPIKDFSNAITQIKKGRGIEERLSEVMSGETDDESVNQNSDVISKGEIELRDVGFAYGRVLVFEHLNIVVHPYLHTAIVGASGTGKTTLGRLMVGLIEEQSGEVLVDGQPMKASERRGCLAYIPQEPMLFNDTIENNIRFGRQWVTDADIAQAVQIAQVGPILDSMPDGLKTVIGDGGSRLSGGERQRISIARALAGNPSIIIMDEATAALDAATEQHFSDQLRETMSGRTLVVIAHRASTIARCDKVYSIEKGVYVR